MKTWIYASFIWLFCVTAKASERPKVGSPAPDFKLEQHDGKQFSLSARKGSAWTVLYFYPKADTPGCTKQACAFRDSIQSIRKLGGDVFGISADSVKDQAAFHQKHALNFVLLADEGAKVAELYGAKMPVVKMSKRWTFLIDKDLVIRWINDNVDPVKDPQVVVEQIEKLQSSGSKK